MNLEDISRDMDWGSFDGRVRPIKELDDTHLLNIVTYLSDKIEAVEIDIKKYSAISPSQVHASVIDKLAEALEKHRAVLTVIYEEIAIRGLDLSLIKGGKELPFKDKHGQWFIWKRGEQKPTSIPNSIDFISPLDEKCK